MKWILIDNHSRSQPSKGTWSDWKEEIAKSCSRQCVYCAIPDGRYGGLDNFHIDHFRPKSLKRFERLANAISNLYLCCAICNRFKSNDWPADPVVDLSTPSYPDPAVVDYGSILQVAPEQTVTGLNVASRYVVERLYLNRPQLIRERRLAHHIGRLTAVVKACRESVTALRDHLDNSGAVDVLAGISERSLRANVVLADAIQSTPYELHEVRKPSRAQKKKISGRKTKRRP